MFGPLVLASLLSVGLCAGGWSVVDTTTDNTDYEALLTSVSSGLEGAHCTTTKIETQVVAGLNIRYTKDCGNGKTCTFVVWQKSWENFLQLTSNECTGHKRQFLAGGYHPVDQSEYAQYEAILSGLESSGDLTVGQFTVTNIETQVVAGTNIRYTLNIHQKTCTIVVYDVPWEHKTTITSNDCPMHRRQLLGGYNTVDASNELVQKCLTMSLDKINAMSNSMYRVVEEQITKAEEQVVVGYNINVEFSTQESTCVNSADNYGKTANDCPVNSNAVMQSSDWKAHCFMNLQGHVSVSVDMV